MLVVRNMPSILVMERDVYAKRGIMGTVIPVPLASVEKPLPAQELPVNPIAIALK